MSRAKTNAAMKNSKGSVPNSTLKSFPKDKNEAQGRSSCCRFAKKLFNPPHSRSGTGVHN
jgi:hypothetical protein